MEPNRGNDRRGEDRRQKNIPVSHDNEKRKGGRRAGSERRDTD